VGVGEIPTCVTLNPKFSHVTSDDDGVTVGVIVGVGVAEAGVAVIDGVAVTDEVTDGVTDGVGVKVGVTLEVGVGVGVTVHKTSPHVVVALLVSSPIIILPGVDVTNVKQFSGSPPMGDVIPDISIIIVVPILPSKYEFPFVFKI